MIHLDEQLIPDSICLSITSLILEQTNKWTGYNDACVLPKALYLSYLISTVHVSVNELSFALYSI